MFSLSLIIAVVVTAGLASIYLVSCRSRKRSLKGRHVMVTGGSSGIGKHVATEAAKLGADVTILARNEALLAEARNEILQYVPSSDDQRVLYFSVDVGGAYENIQEAVQKAQDEFGPVYLLVNNAGYCRAAKFEDTPIHQFKSMMEVNYLGAVQVTHCVVKQMKSRKEGLINFISSDAGLSGIFGFTAYSATKFALRGMAEALAMELKPYNVTVTVTFPPDTDTPGFIEENKDKPEETRLISESSGLHSPQTVAKACINDTLDGQFMSTIGFEGSLLSVLCAGMSPVTSWTALIAQVFFMGFMRLVSVFYLRKFDQIVRRGMKRNQESLTSP